MRARLTAFALRSALFAGAALISSAALAQQPVGPMAPLGGGSGTTYTAGSGITISGNTISLGDANLTYSSGALATTSLALGGATLGSNALAVTGAAAISGVLTTNGYALTTGSIATYGIASTGANDVSFYTNGSRQAAINGVNGQFFLINNSTAIIMGTSKDASLSRISAGVIGVGNGTAGDFSGTLKLGGLNVSGTAGASCTLTAIAHLTVVNGVVTLCN